MGKQGKWQTIMGLVVQDPKEKIFSGKDLVWSEVYGTKLNIDRVAKIPLHRVPDFIKGEEINPDAPCTFICQKKKPPSSRGSAALRYELYHCSYGPEDKREKPIVKRKRRSFLKKRGCQCHFIMKVMVDFSEIAILKYNMYEHKDGEGRPCHGQRDTLGDAGSMHKPKLSRDMVSYVESCFSWDVPIDSVCKMHIKKHVDMDAADRDKDFPLCRKDIANIYYRLKKGKYQLNQKDELSVNLWYKKHQNDFFFYQKPNGEVVPFIVGIQTKWMLETMVKLSHNSLIAMYSTFNTDKYGYQLYTLVAFDEQQSAVPVAWVVASQNTPQDIALWLDHLMHKCYQLYPNWKVNAFMVDDALAEIVALRRITRCEVFLCVWHVRRAWLKNVRRLASSPEKANEMFNDLSFVMKNSSNDEVATAINEFFSKFRNEEKFLDYFHRNWVVGDKIWMWVKGCRDFPHANQETNNAVESYHCYLKTKFLSDQKKKSSRRMDWLLYVLFINVEPHYRFKEILKKEGYLNNHTKENQLESSIEKARRIPDSDCSPHESISHAYWVKSQTKANKQYLVTWYRTNFIACDCPWSICGNICKHAIKVVWLYYPSGDSNLIFDRDATRISISAPPRTSIEAPNFDASTTVMASGNVDLDVNRFQLAKEEFFGIFEMFKKNFPSTISKAEQLIGLARKMVDDANNLHIMDYDFMVGMSALDSSLKRKKNFLSSKKNNKRKKQSSGLEIDLDVPASEYEPFQFPQLNKRGHPRSNIASSMVLGNYRMREEAAFSIQNLPREGCSSSIAEFPSDIPSHLK